MHIATATAPGTAHVNPGQPGKLNNQDVLITRTQGSATVAVLCDGCGSQPYSGTGADIGANIIMNAVCRQLASKVAAADLDWKTVLKETVVNLKNAIGTFVVGNSTAEFEKAVVERFLFTAIVLVVDKDVAVVSAFGDGVVIVDDEVTVLDPPLKNSPPYIGYLLLRNTAYHSGENRGHLAFNVVKTVEFEKLAKGVIVGTDGLKDLLCDLDDEGLHHPALVQPNALQRWLNRQTTETFQDGQFVSGKCGDDVSLVIARSDASQKTLLEARREIVGLKKKIENLEGKITKVSEELETTNLSCEEAEERIESLSKDLARAEAGARKAKQYAEKIAELREEFKQLRNKKPKKQAGLFARALNSLFDLIAPSSESNNPSATPRFKEKAEEKDEEEDDKKGGIQEMNDPKSEGWKRD